MDKTIYYNEYNGGGQWFLAVVLAWQMVLFDLCCFFQNIDSELLIQNYGLNKIIDAISRQMDVSCKTY